MAKAEAVDVNHDAVVLFRTLKLGVDDGAQFVHVQLAGIDVEIRQFLNGLEEGSLIFESC